MPGCGSGGWLWGGRRARFDRRRLTLSLFSLTRQRRRQGATRQPPKLSFGDDFGRQHAPFLQRLNGALVVGQQQARPVNGNDFGGGLPRRRVARRGARVILGVLSCGECFEGGVRVVAGGRLGGVQGVGDGVGRAGRLGWCEERGICQWLTVTTVARALLSPPLMKTVSPWRRGRRGGAAVVHGVVWVGVR